MAGRHRQKRRPPLAVSGWLGAAATTVGVGAALLGAAGTAHADTTSGGDSTTHNAGAASRPDGSTKTGGSKTQTDSEPSSAKRQTAGAADTAGDAAGDASDSTPAKATSKAKVKPARLSPESLPNQVTSALKKASRATASTQAREQEPAASTVPAAASASLAEAAPAQASEAAPTLTTEPAAGKPAVPTVSTTITEPVASPTATISAASSATSEPSTALTVLAGLEQVTTLAGRQSENVAATTATAATAVTTAATDTTPAAATGSTSWLGDDIAQPGSYARMAVREIVSAQASLSANTWGKANVVGGVASIVPQVYLALAGWALQTWQQTNPVALALYGATANILLVGDVTKLALIGTELLPTLAVASLQGAENATDLLKLFGASSAESSADKLISQAAVNGRVYGVVPLTMYANTEPIVEISVNGGPKVKVLVDSGSSGLVIGSTHVGQAGLGDPTGSGSSGYSGGLSYSYDVYNTTVDFGNGIKTGATTVDVVSGDSEKAFEDYLAGNGVVGVLGIGANAVGPGPNLVTAALPGELQDGVYIDQAAGLLVFGPNPMPSRLTLSGSPYTPGVIKAGGQQSQLLWLLIDSGGVYGTIPSTLLSSVPSGTKIAVYASDGSTLLYSYTTNSQNAPTVTSDATANTGNIPFHKGPIYIGYSTAIGTTSFDL